MPVWNTELLQELDPHMHFAASWQGTQRRSGCWFDCEHLKTFRLSTACSPPLLEVISLSSKACSAHITQNVHNISVISGRISKLAVLLKTLAGRVVHHVVLHKALFEHRKINGIAFAISFKQSSPVQKPRSPNRELSGSEATGVAPRFGETMQVPTT